MTFSVWLCFIKSSDVKSRGHHLTSLFIVFQHSNSGTRREILRKYCTLSQMWRSIVSVFLRSILILWWPTFYNLYLHLVMTHVLQPFPTFIPSSPKLYWLVYKPSSLLRFTMFMLCLTFVVLGISIFFFTRRMSWTAVLLTTCNFVVWQEMQELSSCAVVFVSLWAP